MRIRFRHAAARESRHRAASASLARCAHQLFSPGPLQRGAQGDGQQDDAQRPPTEPARQGQNYPAKSLRAYRSDSPPASKNASVKTPACLSGDAFCPISHPPPFPFLPPSSSYAHTYAYAYERAWRFSVAPSSSLTVAGGTTLFSAPLSHALAYMCIARGRERGRIKRRGGEVG